MSTPTKRTPKDQALDAAHSALQPFYAEGDDGDAIRLALDAVVALYLARSGRRARDARGELLAGLSAPVRRDVERLYELAEDAAYGSGLSRSSAREVNDLLQETGERLVDFVRAARPSPPRHKSRRKAS
jgi:hypothetical protein